LYFSVLGYAAGHSAMTVIAYLLAAAGEVPNHPRWPLLVYPGAVALSGDDPAACFEEIFNRNRWPAAWRNGIFPFHHYHADGHEALGIYSGEVTVQFGGETGVTLTARPGDVLVLPAGTGHKRIDCRGALGVVAAYPEGCKPSTSMPPLLRGAKSMPKIVRVPLPACDPVNGADGPLFQHWQPVQPELFA
jgi:uncharacterized protein YjlB